MENKEFRELKFTGERMTNHPESLMYKVSFARYKFAANFVEGKDVLDISCGSGYGSNYLAKRAKSVVGADIDTETINYCRKKYIRNNLEFLCIQKDCRIENFVNKFDAVISFETIEHTKEYIHFLNNLKTYLKENGTIILSTPNNFKKINPPENEFHVYEFDIMELHEIIKKIFIDYKISIFGQCQTSIKRSAIQDKAFFPKRMMRFLIKKVYSFDKKCFSIFRRLEHLRIYQILSKIQGSFRGNISIYKINEREDFLNPLISVFVISKEKTIV